MMGNKTEHEAEFCVPKKGVFWIVDTERLENNLPYIFKVDCNSDGEVLRYASEFPLNSKSGDNYNHKLVWENYLDKQYTYNLPYNYFPRGRVEIKNGVAKIFINPDVATESIIDFLIEQFNLSRLTVKVIVDGSWHYKSLDG